MNNGANFLFILPPTLVVLS